MFVVVIINTNTFGAEGTGTIALVILGLTLLQVLTNFVGGSTLVFLVPQKDNFQLLILSYLWMIISNSIGLFLLYHLKLIPTEYTIHLLILTFTYSIYYTHVSIMQGKEEIKRFNLLQLQQVILLISALIGLILWSKSQSIVPTIDLYLYAFIFSYLVPMSVSFVWIIRNITISSMSGSRQLLVEMFRLGFWTQIANLAQLLTYRINYFLIAKFIGRKPLGIYELGTRLSETVWIFPKSICLVQYARIANEQAGDYAQKLTISLFKIVFIFSLIAVLILLAIPANLIAWIFGPEFITSKPVICSLLPGIICLSCMSVLSHHFAGYGKYWINAICSLIGLIITAALGFVFIPKFANISTLSGLQTAGWISSCAYFCSMVFALICFFRQTTVRWRDFLITPADWQLLKSTIAEYFHKKRGGNA